MQRKYSDFFIERQINKIDELNQKTQQECILFPREFDREEYAWLRKKVTEYVNHRVNRAYIQGFWYGWTLKEGDPSQYEFLERLLNPSDLGHAVTAEVRDEVRVLLGGKRVETNKN